MFILARFQSIFDIVVMHGMAAAAENSYTAGSPVVFYRVVLNELLTPIGAPIVLSVQICLSSPLFLMLQLITAKFSS